MNFQKRLLRIILTCGVGAILLVSSANIAQVTTGENASFSTGVVFGILAVFAFAGSAFVFKTFTDKE